MPEVEIQNVYGETVARVAFKGLRHSEPGTLRAVYPRFDLGKASRQLDRPIRTVYATIDRNGTQAARSTPCRHNASRWMDWR